MLLEFHTHTKEVLATHALNGNKCSLDEDISRCFRYCLHATRSTIYKKCTNNFCHFLQKNCRKKEIIEKKNKGNCKKCYALVRSHKNVTYFITQQVLQCDGAIDSISCSKLVIFVRFYKSSFPWWFLWEVQNNIHSSCFFISAIPICRQI